MYCRKCGKFFDGNAEICAECARAERIAEKEYAKKNKSDADTEAIIVKDGCVEKGKRIGIAGVVIGSIGWIVICIACFIYLFELFAIEKPGLSEYEVIAQAKRFTHMASGLIFTCWAGVVIVIPSAVSGITSIKKFVELNRKGVRSVATLVLGIISLAISVTVFFSGIVLANAMQYGLEEITEVLW
ncbi:MAG: hypothetical protein J6C23_08940 [Clostridia bacterium]|nr:hypothetical protein [Clostridia bacterium]